MVVHIQNRILAEERRIRIPKVRVQPANDAVVAVVEVFRFNEPGTAGERPDDEGPGDRRLMRRHRVVQVGHLSRGGRPDREQGGGLEGGGRTARAVRRMVFRQNDRRQRTVIQKQFDAAPFDIGVPIRNRHGNQRIPH